MALNVGVIGTGEMGRHHVRIYSEIGDVELELYNTDYKHVRDRGVVSRVRRRKKVFVEVE